MPGCWQNMTPLPRESLPKVRFLMMCPFLDVSPKTLHTPTQTARVVSKFAGNYLASGDHPKTLADAADLYLRDKLRMGRDVNGTHSLNRIRKHMEAATGVPFDKMPLEDLTRQHARDTRDYMLRLRKGRKANGDRLSPASVKRALVILSALINYAMEEFDLTDTCRNPFRALPLNVESDTAIERRDALPDDVVDVMTDRLTGLRFLVKQPSQARLSRLPRHGRRAVGPARRHLTHHAQMPSTASRLRRFAKVFGAIPIS